ncbi:MAG: sigma-54-dependent Fis family transcriptional regulator [Desulfuromonadales bacterium]|nr:sigma-54-dependent Fis family transcriptional regulator [Desulfuromonadales bacterium]MBN2793066.1 sigma-54-dependent Fis family transcriptional regulator [Desulfuromonadales bacterium]
MTGKILIVEDDDIMRITVVDHLQLQGWQVHDCTNGSAALTALNQQYFDVIISDIRMPEMNGDQLLTAVKKLSPRTEVIMMTAHGSTQDAINCLKNGAADYILKPFDLDDLTCRVQRLLQIQAIKARCVSLENTVGRRQPLIGSSAPMQKLLNLISQVSQSDSTVLIHGESGTGKELVAAAIHFESSRAEKPYIRVNCAAIPDGLLESELFGHEKGAFTGADQTRPGKFELADQGTILLDEIGDLPLHLQVKLLRVLQEREIERIGAGLPTRIDVRVICATTKNLADEVKQGRFREDLFYRLQVIPLTVPPLRERSTDISVLTAYFLEYFGGERGRTFKLSGDAMQALERYPFPGNVRELRNLIERITVLAPATEIQLWDLPLEIRGIQEDCMTNEEPCQLSTAVAQAERSCILRALEKSSGNKTLAAEILGISRKNLWEKMKLYAL